jgi:hypothetical protein
MSNNLQKCLQELNELNKLKDKKSKQAVLKFLANKKCIYLALREISLNVLNKQIPLNKKQLEKLGPHAKTIKALACGTNRKHIQKKLVEQSGGFLPYLIPIVSTLLPAVIDLFKK